MEDTLTMKIKREVANKLSKYRKAGETWTQVIDKLISKARKEGDGGLE